MHGGDTGAVHRERAPTALYFALRHLSQVHALCSPAHTRIAACPVISPRHHVQSQSCRRKTGVGSYGPARRKKGARVIVFREGEAPSHSETYLRLQDGSVEVQARAWRPPWQRRQWACEAGALSACRMPENPCVSHRFEAQARYARTTCVHRLVRARVLPRTG